MYLQQLGLSQSQQQFLDQHLDFTPGRVIKQHKDRYEVMTEDGRVSAEVTGNLRFTAESASDFPAVGDWVLMMGLDDLFLIHKILPRQTRLGKAGCFFAWGKPVDGHEYRCGTYRTSSG